MSSNVNNNRNTPRYYAPTSAGDIVEHLKAIDTTLGNVVSDHRVGEIIIIMDATIPSYALECDGSTISRTTYADLYAVLGDRYGNGDGSTTFEIPDYRGRMLRGCGLGYVSNGTNANPDHASRTARADGATVTNLYPGTTEDHEHISHLHGMARSTNNRTGGAGNIVTGSGANHSLAASGGNEDRPENQNVYFCIVHTGH